MTVAPCSASRAAIARPMPRDAPVTSATFPDRLNMVRGASLSPLGWLGVPRARRAAGEHFLDGLQIIRSAEADDRGLALHLAHQSAQDGARTHLNIRCDALGRK